MIHIKLIHIFIVLLVLKLISKYVDYNFYIIVLLTSFLLFYLYINNQLKFSFFNNKLSYDTITNNNKNVNYPKNQLDLDMSPILLANINKKDFEIIFNDYIKQLIILSKEFIIAPNDIQQDLINSINIFCYNADFIFDGLFDGKLQYCQSYIDIINDHRMKINDLTNSIILTTPQLTNYNTIYDKINNIQFILDNIFNILSYKCANSIDPENLNTNTKR